MIGDGTRRWPARSVSHDENGVSFVDISLLSTFAFLAAFFPAFFAAFFAAFFSFLNSLLSFDIPRFLR
jgi:hypothetical protein